MSLQHIVLNKIHRADFNGATELNKNSQENPSDGVCYSIFEQAKQQLNRSAAKRFGFFDKDAEHQQLIGLITNWLDDQINFLSLANKASETLQHQLELSETPFNATLLFAEETILGQRYFYCFWLNMVDSIQLGEDLQPYKSEAIDPSKVSFALRLHIDDWQDGESPKYLTVITSKGNKDLSDAFTRFDNFTEGIDLGKQTKEFLEIVSDYSETMDDNAAKDFKTSVLDYCVEQDKVGSPVVINDISEQISQAEPEKFSSFVAEKQEVPLEEIHTDRQSLKRYMRYFGRDNSLSISFSAERFGSDIIYEPTSGSLKINKLPKSLKVQLSGFADKMED